MKKLIDKLREDAARWMEYLLLCDNRESIQLADLIHRLDDGLRKQQELINDFETQFKEMTALDHDNQDNAE